MKTILLSVFAVAAFISPACAKEVSQSAATHFISTFYQALQKHDLTTVSNMIDDGAMVKVLWIQANPPQTFTLKKADYLQQLKATWRFATNDRYEMKNIKVTTVNGITIVGLQETQSRILFGKKAGQNNELKISLSGDSQTIRIIAINSKTELR